jgi:hypothetical protein
VKEEFNCHQNKHNWGFTRNAGRNLIHLIEGFGKQEEKNNFYECNFVTILMTGLTPGDYLFWYFVDILYHGKF